MNDVHAIERGPLRTVLVGLDGSPASERAMAWATARCCETGARLLAAHVFTYSAELALDLPPTGMTSWRRHTTRELKGEWTRRAREAGVRVEIELIEHDSVAGGLVTLAARESADLVVLGAHGHGNFAERLLGSTTYRIAHRAPVPVVIVPPDWKPPVAA